MQGVATQTYEDLIGKIAVARDRLSQKKRRHKDRCVVETDPDGFAPCSCGASEFNAAIDEAIRVLK